MHKPSIMIVLIYDQEFTHPCPDNLQDVALQALEGEAEQRLQARKQAAQAAHRRLRVAQSDALNALSAFVSWLGTQDKDRFCR